MYRIGHRKRRIRHHLFILATIFIAVSGVISGIIWYYINVNGHTEIKQSSPSQQNFSPANATKNLLVSTNLYSMELPSDWKQTSVNSDNRYNSIKWTLQSGAKNRWLEIFTDKIPTDMAFNKIIPVSIKGSSIVADSMSDNCSKFTPKQSDSNLKVPSKWQYASFLCDLSNYTDNVIGVSEKNSGTIFTLTGKLNGQHRYMIVYTDRGIPEDPTPLNTVLQTLSPK